MTNIVTENLTKLANAVNNVDKFDNYHRDEAILQIADIAAEHNAALARIAELEAQISPADSGEFFALGQRTMKVTYHITLAEIPVDDNDEMAMEISEEFGDDGESDLEDDADGFADILAAGLENNEEVWAGTGYWMNVTAIEIKDAKWVTQRVPVPAAEPANPRNRPVDFDGDEQEEGER